jgi:hypothetical protein
LPKPSTPWKKRARIDGLYLSGVAPTERQDLVEANRSMAHSDANRPTLRPTGHLVSHSIQPVALPLESEPPTSDVAGEDFLYHLSRGSELLKENLVAEAKEALELALSLQPRDLRGQGLLGVVYFRLGLYPRAIDIYRQIVDAFSDEVTPKVNLALCYVKTGQHHAARELLEDVVNRDPEHHRAWAYLGLTFQFMHDFAKAEAAFGRAGQHGMAGRMHQLIERSEVLPEENLVGEDRWELRAAAHDAFGEIESKTKPFHADEATNPDNVPGYRWRATEPGEEAIPAPNRPARRPSTPPPGYRPPSFRPPPLPVPLPIESAPDAPSSAPTRVAGDLTAVAAARGPAPRRVHLRDWLVQRAPALGGGQAAVVDPRTLLVELDEPFAVRATAVLVVSPSEIAKREVRVLCRTHSTEEAEPLGGKQSPVVGYFGPGSLIARAESGILDLFELDDESITVRQSALFGFSLGLRYESEQVRLGRNDDLVVVRLNGRGTVALNLSAEAKTLDLAGDGLLVRLGELVGWTARVLPEVADPAEAPGRARGYVLLRGEGTAIVV